ncbi:MAG TPA: hypothetical protein VK909_15340, partial [Anaerolineales bacterium]|nr:hypothetical protein [Anaerolineales bacterium]
MKITAEVKPEGNILSSKMYPEIREDTVNFIVPYHTEEEKSEVRSTLQMVMGQQAMKQINIFSIKHPLNGWFVVFQANL